MVNANSLKNLKPFQDRDKRELSEISRMGQKKGIESKKRKKTFKELIEFLGTQNVTEIEKPMFEKMFPGIDAEEITKDMMVIASMYHQAIVKGNVKAASMIRDTKGEKPETVINGNLTTEKIFISPEEHAATLEHIKEVISDGADD